MCQHALCKRQQFDLNVTNARRAETILKSRCWLSLQVDFCFKRVWRFTLSWWSLSVPCLSWLSVVVSFFRTVGGPAFLWFISICRFFDHLCYRNNNIYSSAQPCLPDFLEPQCWKFSAVASTPAHPFSITRSLLLKSIRIAIVRDPLNRYNHSAEHIDAKPTTISVLIRRRAYQTVLNSFSSSSRSRNSRVSDWQTIFCIFLQFRQHTLCLDYCR
jgi:hypothetical protein